MAISGDNRFNGASRINTPSINGGSKAGAPAAPQEAAITDGFSRSATVEGTKAPQFVNHTDRVKHPHSKEKPWASQLRDAGGFAQIGAAGAIGGVGAAVAVGQLQYPDGRWNLGAIADKALKDNNLPTTYPAAVIDQVAAITAPATAAQGTGKVQDLRSEPWSAVDNATTRDVDQIAFSTRLPDGSIRVRVAVTDVDALVPKDSPLDKHMLDATSSIYTPDKIYNMLPEKLSTDLISLNQGEDRLATVFDYTVAPDGSTKDEKVYQAMVNNQAQLDYPTVGDWLEGKSDMPEKLKNNPVMADQIAMQNEASQRLQAFRAKNGALEFASSESHFDMKDGNVVGVSSSPNQLSNKLVENQMVTANQVQSRFLREKNHPDRPNHPNGYPTIQRIVARPPQDKWTKIAAIAAQNGYKLPDDVNNKDAGPALGNMLRDEKAKNPDKFADLSLSVVKLIGRGEFVAVSPDEKPPGHFGMGITDYVQSTASMRRDADVVNARIMKAAIQDKDCPYSMAELQSIAEQVTNREQDIKKAERQVTKSAAAVYLEPKIGEKFDGVVTGVKGDNVWVKIGTPPVEGKLNGGKKLDIGDKIKDMTLSKVNVVQGQIDFKR